MAQSDADQRCATGAPAATYRLQFNRQFGFDAARSIVSYLHQLGISHLYASPLMRPRFGSSHGYDIVDPCRLNPELGSEGDFDALHRELESHAMGLLLDIVPNHMAAHSSNVWWMDVLEYGPRSPYATFFDINWHPAGSPIDNKVLLPVLGRPYSEVLEDQELALKVEERGIFVHYYDARLPINMSGLLVLLAYRIADLKAELGAQHPDVLSLTRLMQAYSGPMQGVSQDRIRSHKNDLRQLVQASAAVRAHLHQNIDIFNGTRGLADSFNRLDDLLSRQFYHLAFWRSASEQLNYRRFFDINDLAAVRVEDATVFTSTHSLILRLVQEGKVGGLRLDHIDGLFDPFAYLNRLRSQTAALAGADGCYVVAEKILAGDEQLCQDWPLAGTTGYDFLNALNGLFVDANGLVALRDGYARFTGSGASFGQLVVEKKVQVSAELFASDVRSLSYQLAVLALHDRYGRDISRAALKAALIAITARLPVYRTYTRDMQVSREDRAVVERAVEAAGRHSNVDKRALSFVRRVLLLDIPDNLEAEQRAAWLDFVMRWQQFTGPVMAKGVEDTALYNYNCLISLNDVGGEPGAGHVGIEHFHRFNQTRMRRWPHSMSATSTHDTKRSEDVRARVNVLSEIPREWQRRVLRWWRWNQDKKVTVNGAMLPDANSELLIYQTMIGAWPLHEDDIPAFKERLAAYVVKAAREAKVLTSWRSPEAANESALVDFVNRLMEPAVQNRFLEDFLPFQKRVAFYGAINALSQVVLKATAPGVPDFYQGTELWDFSLVDPDNRRPVDFECRREMLDDVRTREQSDIASLLGSLLDTWQDGRIKLYVTRNALAVRTRYRDVFGRGTYIPVQGTGHAVDQVCAFLRQHGEQWTLSVAPRLISQRCPAGRFPVGEGIWGDDVLSLPDGAPSGWFNVFTNERVTTSAAHGGLRLAEVFSRFPIALFIAGD